MLKSLSIIVAVNAVILLSFTPATSPLLIPPGLAQIISDIAMSKVQEMQGATGGLMQTKQAILNSMMEQKQSLLNILMSQKTAFQQAALNSLQNAQARNPPISTQQPMQAAPNRAVRVNVSAGRTSNNGGGSTRATSAPNNMRMNSTPEDADNQ